MDILSYIEILENFNINSFLKLTLYLTDDAE
jgi:hypothetical protein